MAYSSSSLLVFVAAALLYGCSIGAPAGEQPAQCADRRDNDDDGAMDCDDTDCQALSVCGPAALTRDASLPPSQIGDAFVGETDAGTSEPPLVPSVVEPVDSSTPEPEPEPEPVESGCPGGCGPNEHCVVDECLVTTVVVADIWTITRIDVRVPRSIDTGASPTCLDRECDGFYLRRAPYFSCECPPDPQVQVWVDVDPNDTLDVALTGQTSVDQKQDQARWTDPIEIRLLPASIVHLKVVDVDGDGFEPIYDCEIPGASAQISATGTLECEQLFPDAEAPGAIEFAITAQLEPTQVEPTQIE